MKLLQKIDIYLYQRAQILFQYGSFYQYSPLNLKHKFGVIGQPTLLIINPDNETILKQWSSEPYSMTPVEFIQQVKMIISRK